MSKSWRPELFLSGKVLSRIFRCSEKPPEPEPVIPVSYSDFQEKLLIPAGNICGW
jgi:hypothetical protein